MIMASSAGFEPTAFRLGGERSILLSYEDINHIYPDCKGISKKKNLKHNARKHTA